MEESERGIYVAVERKDGEPRIEVTNKVLPREKISFLTTKEQPPGTWHGNQDY